MQITVGFDLDLTLADTRAGVARVREWLPETAGAAADGAAVAGRRGPSPEEEPARPSATAMPGAAEAIAAVRAAGGRVLVVGAGDEAAVRGHVEHLGLDVDEVLGGAPAGRKGRLLVRHAAAGGGSEGNSGGAPAGELVYVGGHRDDLIAARAAGATAVGVATGGADGAEPTAAGADVVLDDLAAFPEWVAGHALSGRLEALDARMRELDSVLVAFSGGADSAFTLAAAVRSLGPENVVAATASSPSLPEAELGGAVEFAASLGVRHLTPATNEMDRAGYRANSGMRCYFCKSELLDVLGPVAEEQGLAHVVTGTNADDVGAGFRPGIRAAAERGALTPLVDAGFTKAQVREGSRRWGLTTWDKPAAACLSSRIAYGIEVTPTRLARVEHAESALRNALATAGIAVRNLRVRDLGETARVEVDADQVDRVLATPTVIEQVRAAGFESVEVDPAGFRSGSMNELLPNPERYR